MVSPPSVTCRSCIASSSADCTLAGARLISSASTRLAKTGPLRGVIVAVLRIVNQRADDVGGQQVGRELDAMKLRLDGRGQRADGQRLGQARHAFEQDMAVGEQADEQPVHQMFLADDDLADFLAQPADPGRGALHCPQLFHSMWQSFRQGI